MKLSGKIYVNVKVRIGKAVEKAVGKLTEKDGSFLEEALKYILAIVVGALFLAGIYLLFKDIIIPTVGDRVRDLFNYTA